MSNISDKCVVIFGGGIAGVQLARQLSEGVKVTLVDANDYFEVPMAAPRNLVRPSFAKQSIIPYAEALPGVTVVRGTLVEMSARSGRVVTSDGREAVLGGDVNVLSTGSLFANSLMRAQATTARERMRFYGQYQQAIAAAHRVLIVGGGPIGVEVAGEISESHPQKAITLLEGDARLLAGTSELAAQHVTSVLTGRGVSIVVGERLQSATTAPEDVFGVKGQATTTSGRTIDYDLLIWCTGGRPNTFYMKAHLGDALDDRGRIRVSPDLRVVGHEAMFALGDITDLKENKMAWHISRQVKHAATNIRRILRDPRATNLVAHRPQTDNPKMAITLGSRQGVLHLPIFGVIRSPWFTRKAKAEHMLVPKYRRLLNLLPEVP